MVNMLRWRLVILIVWGNWLFTTPTPSLPLAEGIFFTTLKLAVAHPGDLTMIRVPFILMVVLKSKKRHDDTVNIYAMIHPK